MFLQNFAASRLYSIAGKLADVKNCLLLEWTFFMEILDFCYDCWCLGYLKCL